MEVRGKLKLFFIHDGPVYYDENGRYYEYALHGLYERYRYLAEDITFVIRAVPLSEETKNTLIPEQVKIVPLPNFKDFRYFAERIKEAAQIIDRELSKADIVILRGSSSALIAYKYVKKYKCPFIYECVDCEWDAYWNHSFLGKLIAPIIEVKTKVAIKNSPFVYYVTNNYLQKRYPTKGKSIGCSNVVIENQNFEVLTKRIDRIKKFDPNKKLILGTAAAIDVRYKGQEYVIRALKFLAKQGYNVEYRLAGGNRLNSNFLSKLAKQQGVEDRVYYCGSLSANEMASFYDSLDIYIQPSKQEGLPRSLIEAMSRGCLCIGTNVAGIPELISKEFLFKKGSVKGVYNAIICVLKSDMKKVAKENFRKAEEYKIENLDKRRRTFYDDFLEENENRFKNELKG